MWLRFPEPLPPLWISGLASAQSVGKPNVLPRETFLSVM